MRLFFVNRYYWPDESATSLMLTDLAEGLAAAGHEVHVLTSRQKLEDPAASLPAEAVQHRVQVHRLRTTGFGRARLATRALDYLSFYFAAWMFLLRRLRKGDVVIAKTDPPLICVVAGAACALRGARLVNWLQDVYPEIAFRLGALPESGPLAGTLLALRNGSLRRAAFNVVVGERMRSYIEEAAPGCASVSVIPNWSQVMESDPAAILDNAYRRQLGLADNVVIGYSGNLGRAHEFQTVLDAAALLTPADKIHFLIIGGGAQAASVQQQAAARGLKNWTFLSYQPRERLAESLGAADIHLVSLHPSLEGLIVPSKIYGILAAGRPCVFIGATDGEVARLLQEYDCGVSVLPGDPRALAAALRRLASFPEMRLDQGKRARDAQRFWHLPQNAVQHWRQLLDRL